MGPANDIRALSIDQQIDRMCAEYPLLYLLHATEWGVVWQGGIRPLAQTYDVQIHYCAFRLDIANIEARTVHVESVSPELRHRSDANIPHVYPNRVKPTRPRLCLHMRHEWDASLYIADTIVPWTAEWLVAYEGWRATGKWFAGGHNTARPAAQVGR
jgi:hypothetical protein